MKFPFRFNQPTFIQIWLLLLTVWAGLSTTQPCSALSFSSSSVVRVQANDFTNSTHDPFTSMFPFQTNDSVITPAGSSSSAIYDLNSNFLRIDFTQVSIGSTKPSGVTTLATGDGFIGDIQVVTNTPYLLTGRYSATGGSPYNTNDNSSPNFSHSASLRDATDGVFLFSYVFASHAPNAVSDLIGPGLSGILLPGHQYSLTFQYLIGNPLIDGYGSSASGFLQFQTAFQLVPPHFTSATSSGGNLTVSGSAGQTNGNYYILSSTNITLPLTSWTRFATNTFDGSGNFAFTNSINPDLPQCFFIIQLP